MVMCVFPTTNFTALTKPVKIALFFIGTLIFTQTFAQENKSFIKGPLQVIHKINTQALIGKDYNCDESWQPLASPLLNQCALDLCGPAEKNKTIWVTDSNFSSHIPPEILQKVEELNPLFEKMFSHSLQRYEKELLQITSVFSENDESQILNNLKSYKEILFSATYKKRAINKCKAMLIRNEIKTANFKKTTELFKKAKESIIKNFFPYFSESSKKTMARYLEKKLIPSNVDLKKELTPTDGIAAFIEMAPQYLESTNNYIRPSDKKSLRQEGIYLSKLTEEDESFHGKFLPCQKPSISIWDAYLSQEAAKNILRNGFNKNLNPKYTKNDHLFISDFSSENAIYGEYFVSHEIGHALNNLFAQKKLSQKSTANYKTIRQCISQNFPVFSNLNYFKLFDEDSLHTEEDMADLIAAIAFPKKEQISTCAFLEPSFKMDQYVDLFLIDEERPHSAPLARILMEASYKKIPLPASCQNLIQNESSSFGPNQCI